MWSCAIFWCIFQSDVLTCWQTRWEVHSLCFWHSTKAMSCFWQRVICRSLSLKHTVSRAQEILAIYKNMPKSMRIYLEPPWTSQSKYFQISSFCQPKEKHDTTPQGCQTCLAKMPKMLHKLAQTSMEHSLWILCDEAVGCGRFFCFAPALSCWWSSWMSSLIRFSLSKWPRSDRHQSSIPSDQLHQRWPAGVSGAEQPASYLLWCRLWSNLVRMVCSMRGPRFGEAVEFARCSFGQLLQLCQIYQYQWIAVWDIWDAMEMV